MPNLERVAVAAWLHEQEDSGATPSLSARPSPVDEDQLRRLGEMLDGALAADPARLSSLLRSGPVADDLRTVLAQWEPAQLMRFLHWLATVGLPKQGDVLYALLVPSRTGTGQALHAALTAMHREALLARIFQPNRVQALRRACRTLTVGEATRLHSMVASTLAAVLALAPIAATAQDAGSANCALITQAAANGITARIAADDRDIAAPRSVTTLSCLDGFFSGVGLNVITNLLNPATLLSAVEGKICGAVNSTWNSMTGSLQCGLTVSGFDLGFGGLGGGAFCPNLSFGGGGPTWGSVGLGGTMSGGGGLVVNGASVAPTGYLIPNNAGFY